MRSIETAEQEGYSVGVKLVRGAYHSQEHLRIAPYQPDISELRKTKGIPKELNFAEGPSSAVWDAKAETDAAYNAAADILLDKVKDGAPVGCTL
jgi:proline dehydrogenase